MEFFLILSAIHYIFQIITILAQWTQGYFMARDCCNFLNVQYYIAVCMKTFEHFQLYYLYMHAGVHNLSYFIPTRLSAEFYYFL